MESCVGCHSCEVACAEQNGLPAGTVWRRVGEIEGGDHPDTRRFHLSLSCNHCLDPACLNGCPTNAYEKLATGIVAHHADDCIGCRYCMAACPYGARSFNWRDPRPYIKKINPDYPTRERGVVEKCNFCVERLAFGELPACVEACKSKALIFGDLGNEERLSGLFLGEGDERPQSILRFL